MGRCYKKNFKLSINNKIKFSTTNKILPLALPAYQSLPVMYNNILDTDTPLRIGYDEHRIRTHALNRQYIRYGHTSPYRIRQTLYIKRKMAPAQGRKGRVYPHQRSTDDVGVILGAEFELPDNYKAKYQETINHDMSDTCRRDYRNRMKRIKKFLKELNPQMYTVGIVDVSKTDQHNKSKHFFKGHLKKDRQYTGLNVDYGFFS